MKPTPLTRPLWMLGTLFLAGTALLCWGCGHTREVLYPGRKVSPPRTAKGRRLVPAPSPTLTPVEPGRVPPRSRAGWRSSRQPDAPSAIDVPMIDPVTP